MIICSIFHTNIVCSTAIIEEIAHRRLSTSEIAFYGISAHHVIPPLAHSSSRRFAY